MILAPGSPIAHAELRLTKRKYAFQRTVQSSNYTPKRTVFGRIRGT